jgi:1,4-alpha-glucan branching enzyme
MAAPPRRRFEVAWGHPPRRFPWTDGGWPGVAREGQVLYEMHVGTFTKEGTYGGGTPAQATPSSTDGSWAVSGAALVLAPESAP